MRILEAAQAVATFLRRRPLTRNLRTPDKSDRGGAEQSFRWSKECTGSKDEATLKRDIEQLRKTGNFAEASRVIEDALVQFPSSVSILTERGWLHHDQHHYDEAISDFDKVLHIDRSNEGALQGKIAQLRLKGSAIDPAFFDQAHDLLREALKYHPKSLGLLSERGWLFLAQKQYDRATKAFVEVQNVPGFQQVMAQLRAQRRLAEASTLIENIPPPFNQNLAVICERGWLSFSKRQYDEAITLFDQVLASEMKHAAKEGAFQGKIASLRLTRQVDEANALIVKALAQFPDSIGISSERGWLAFSQGELEQAAAHFEDLSSQHPDNVQLQLSYVEVLRSLNRSHEGLAILQELGKRFPDDLEITEKIGLFDLLHHDLNEAQEKFQEILLKHPKNPLGTNGQGLIYFAQGLFEKAEIIFRELVKDDPSNPIFHTNLARALVRQGNPDELDEAEKHCGTALQFDPRSASAFGCLGVIAFKRGKISDSEHWFKRSVMVSPLEGDYTDLGALYIQIGRYKEAEDNLFEAIKRSAHNTQAHVELGNLYLARESVKDAILEFRQAVSIDPSNEEASRALSIALMQKGDFSAAEKILQDAIRAYSGPDRWQLHLTLAQLLTEVGNKTSDLKAYEAGLDQINKAIKLNPLHPQPYFYGGIVRTKLGLYDASIRNFQTCLEKDKDNYLAERYIGLLRSQLREEHRRSQGSVIAGWLIAGFATVQLVALWYFYLTTSKVTEQTLTVIAPTLLVMIVLGLLVPRLIKFKIPGFEAELKQPLEAVASGPKGEVGFGALTVSTNPGPR